MQDRQERISRRALLGGAGLATLVAAAGLAGLSGCAAPSEPLGMALSEGDALQLRGWMPAALQGQVAAAPVSGGEPTNKIWGSKLSDLALEHALQDSLRSVGLLALHPEQARYELRSELLGLSQPLLALDTTVSLSLHFRLLERAREGQAERLLYQRTVRTAHTTELGDALLSQPERMRLANEAAARRAITLMLRDLPNLRL